MSTPSLEAIAERFAALWDALCHDGDHPRPREEIGALLDRVRDALDRRSARLAPEEARFVAGSFALDRLVHQGTATEIHRIRHRDLGTVYALKTLRPDRAEDVIARALLLREARFGLALRHRHVAATEMALRLPDGRPALVLAWHPASLAKRLVTGAAFTLAEIRLLLEGLLRGLGAIHGAGLVHADIAPDNLLLEAGDLGRPKIADFGIAIESGRRHADLDLARADHRHFAAPEQLAGAALDGRSDIYACGRIGLVLLERCGEGGDRADRLREIVRRFSATAPARRPHDPSEALALLGASQCAVRSL